MFDNEHVYTLVQQILLHGSSCHTLVFSIRPSPLQSGVNCLHGSNTSVQYQQIQMLRLHIAVLCITYVFLPGDLEMILLTRH